MYNAVGIDVSKGKSTVAILQPGGTVIRKPFDVSHTSQNLHELAKYLDTLNGDTRIVMECTGRYHEPILKAFNVLSTDHRINKNVVTKTAFDNQMRIFTTTLYSSSLPVQGNPS